MSTYVLTLSDPQATLENVGGKGMSLAKLTRAGLPVPGGFHITTEAYRRFVSENGLQPRILAALQGIDSTDPTALEPVSRQIGGFFAEGRIPTEIAESVSAAYTALRPQTIDGRPSNMVNGQSSIVGAGAAVAVRSSATAEDLPGASFAGQQETYLNIRGTEAVLDAVKRCWASLWTARAIAYRSRQGIEPDSVALAVVVQELVFADAAGVMFTANPVNGRRDEIMITATWGLGEAIVSGAVTPDTLTVAKPTGRLIRRETAEKQVMTVRTESGTSEVPVPDSKKKKAVLSDAQIAELAKLGTDIEKLYAMPMDIEWTLAAGKFAIVQARPVTALPDAPLEWPLPHPKAVLARGSFAEFVPEPISPLFATLAVPLAWDSTVRLMNNFGVTGKDSYQFAVINSYLYVGMVITPRMTWQMTRASFALIKPILKTAWKKSVAAREKFLGIVEKWHAQELNKLTAPELLAGTREIFSATAEFYNMAQSATIPTSLTSEAVFGMFYKTLVKRKGDPDAPTFVFGSENNAIRSEKALFDLTMWAKSQPELADYLTRTPADVISAALQTDPQPFDSAHIVPMSLREGKPVPVLREFALRFDIYLREFGHAIYDLDFAKPVPADDPAPLVETIKVYLSGKNSPYERQRDILERREQSSERIIKRLDPLRRKWFIKMLAWAQETAPLRENSIADMGLGHPQIRRMLRELGRRLVAGGAIVCVEDVYWLEAHEADMLATLLEKREALKNFSAEVANRKVKLEAMKHITPPNTLPQKTWMSKFYADNEQSGNTIKGFGASAGKVTARACVMLGPEDFSKMQPGDVIVAGITTPAWTPLFARAAGIVTDIGGPLSHSSIVAREYGIPAVLATGVGTRHIKDGQIITVDGTAGTVELK